MSPNKQVVEEYMEGFRRGDHARILACLAADVEWEMPGHFHIHGKEAFGGHIEGEGFAGLPEIDVSRLTEEHDVVIAEGSVRAHRADGAVVNLAFCDVFEMRDGPLRRLVSYLVPVG